MFSRRGFFGSASPLYDFLGSAKWTSQHRTEIFLNKVPANEIPGFGKKVNVSAHGGMMFSFQSEQSRAALVLHVAYLFGMGIILSLIHLK